MAWNVIRKATEEDVKKLESAAWRFCSRNAISTDECEPLVAIEYELMKEREDRNELRLNRDWIRIVRRALDHSRAEGIAYGTIGYNI